MIRLFVLISGAICCNFWVQLTQTFPFSCVAFFRIYIPRKCQHIQSYSIAWQDQSICRQSLHAKTNYSQFFIKVKQGSRISRLQTSQTIQEVGHLCAGIPNQMQKIALFSSSFDQDMEQRSIEVYGSVEDNILFYSQKFSFDAQAKHQSIFLCIWLAVTSRIRIDTWIRRLLPCKCRRPFWHNKPVILYQYESAASIHDSVFDAVHLFQAYGWIAAIWLYIKKDSLLKMQDTVKKSHKSFD